MIFAPFFLVFGLIRAAEPCKGKPRGVAGPPEGGGAGNANSSTQDTAASRLARCSGRERDHRGGAEGCERCRTSPANVRRPRHSALQPVPPLPRAGQKPPAPAKGRRAGPRALSAKPTAGSLSAATPAPEQAPTPIRSTQGAARSRWDQKRSDVQYTERRNGSRRSKKSEPRTASTGTPSFAATLSGAITRHIENTSSTSRTE